MNRYKKILKDKVFNSGKGVLIYSLLLVLLGFLILGLVRFIFVHDHRTHYHANFALYVNGEKDEFNSFTYYEEVTACSDASKMDPKSRAHMHNNVNSIVHVHDDAVTWGHFFSNLGYIFNDNLLITPKGRYEPGDDKKFSYILNGERVKNISDKVIKSEDTLLINFGSESEQELSARYSNITRDAHEFNLRADPGGCAGADEESLTKRIKRSIFE